MTMKTTVTDHIVQGLPDEAITDCLGVPGRPRAASLAESQPLRWRLALSPDYRNQTVHEILMPS